MEISDSIEIAAPPEEVAARIADLSTWGDWLVIHAGFPDGEPDSIAPGEKFKESVRILGLPGEVTWTVKAVDLGDPAVIDLEGRGTAGTKMTACFRIASAADGCRVEYDAGYGGFALRPVKGRLEEATRKASAESLKRLRDLIRPD